MNSIFKNDEFQTSVKFANGEYAISRKQLPWKIKAIERLHHGDLKTISTRDESDKFIGLEIDEEAILVDIWRNFYGEWARVQRDNGDYIDVRPNMIDIVSV